MKFIDDISEAKCIKIVEDIKNCSEETEIKNIASMLLRQFKQNEIDPITEEYKQKLIEEFLSSPVWISTISAIHKPFCSNQKVFQLEIKLNCLEKLD